MQCVCGAAVACAGWGRRKPQRPHPTPCYKLKTKFFRGSSAMPLLLPKYSFGRGTAAPLPTNTLKQNYWGGRGAGTPAPQLRLAPENLVSLPSEGEG